MDVDEALRRVGGWGYYQKRLYALVFISAIPNACIVMHFVFSNRVPEHRCRLPHQLESIAANISGNSSSSILQSAIPYEVVKEENKSRLSQCKMYQMEIAYVNLTSEISFSNKTIDCNDGYAFELKDDQSTASAEFPMVCNNDWQPYAAVAAYQIGNGIGALSISLADRFGRRRVFLLSCIFHVLSAAFISATWNYYTYAIAGFVCGVFAQLNYGVAFVVATEMTDAGWRNFMAAGLMYSFSVGYCLVALLGYIFHNWRWYLGVASMISAAFYLPNFWLFPESIRWLVQKGNEGEGLNVLADVAKKNGKYGEFEELQQLAAEGIVAKPTDPETSFVKTLKLLLKSGIASRCLVTAFLWFVTSLVYYSIAYFSTSFSEDLYLNVLFAGLAEFPSCVCAFFSLKTIGRPRSMFFFMMLCGVTSVILPFVPRNLSYVRTVISVIGKGAVTAEFYVAYLVASELVPTLQRSSNMSLCSGAARVGSFVAPFLMYLSKLHGSVPNLVMGLMSFTSAILAVLFIPETKGIPFPESEEEARNNKRIYGLNLCKTFNTVVYKTGNKKDEENTEELL